MTFPITESLTRTARNLILGASLCFASMGCNAIDPALRPQSLLPSSSWRLVGMEGQPVEGRAVPNIRFSEKSIAGDTGCNRYSAPMSLSGYSITIGVISSSKAACEALFQDRELRYLEQLAHASRLEVTPKFLAIYCAGAEHPLRFARED